mmetsp:Transcript_8303/g.51720  ORF Transcript_8303/g.51720 Transcript_8303/m.51720 type:complete len:251 (+) Transcript_8303:4359-5111(+)
MGLQLDGLGLGIVPGVQNHGEHVDGTRVATSRVERRHDVATTLVGGLAAVHVRANARKAGGRRFGHVLCTRRPRRRWHRLLRRRGGRRRRTQARRRDPLPLPRSSGVERRGVRRVVRSQQAIALHRRRGTSHCRLGHGLVGPRCHASHESRWKENGVRASCIGLRRTWCGRRHHTAQRGSGVRHRTLGQTVSHERPVGGNQRSNADEPCVHERCSWQRWNPKSLLNCCSSKRASRSVREWASKRSAGCLL